MPFLQNCVSISAVLKTEYPMKITGENLNDKFLNIAFLKDFEGMYPPLANECELIAVEFAVEFAKWNENYPAHLKYDEKGKYLGLEKLVIIFKNKFYGKIFKI